MSGSAAAVPAYGSLMNGALDLTRYAESTHRLLYDAVVELLWTPMGEEVVVPSHTPDEMELMVTYLHGRWIASWTDLEEPETALPDQRTQMVRVLADPESRFGIVLQEI